MILAIVPSLETRTLRDRRLPTEHPTENASEFVDRRPERLYVRGVVLRDNTADLIHRSRRASGRSHALLTRSRVRISRS
jgi:hypothetical protein